MVGEARVRRANPVPKSRRPSGRRSCKRCRAPVRTTQAQVGFQRQAVPGTTPARNRKAMRIDDQLPLMLWSVRPDMSCEYVSRAWLEFTGYAPEQALGHGWSRAVHAEDLARWLDTC